MTSHHADLNGRRNAPDSHAHAHDLPRLFLTPNIRMDAPSPLTGDHIFRELADTIEDVFWLTTPDKTSMLYVSLAYERIWGRTCRSLYDQPLSWLDAIHPEDRDRVRKAALAQAAGGYNEVYRIIRPDNQTRWIRDIAFPVRNDSGQVERVAGIARDITEYRQMSEQLRHSQKMEALGQLAGGVAHDFNNILAAIILQTELTASRAELCTEIHDGLRQIRASAVRAANLVRQLLLFSRKEIMQARTLDLNHAVANLSRMIQRVIGEHIHLQLQLHSAPLPIHADAVMLDQVLINLAVNARDAMPSGGPLLIRTGQEFIDEYWARLHPGTASGHYVYITVEDSGVGISHEVLPHIFEPFFTTKEPGKGTGLGLSTVFGIVRQHEGFIEVESQPGRGTAFQIFLPASKAMLPGASLAESLIPSGGKETILLVEDDSAVRLSIHALLKRSGYRILEAPNGVQALKIWETHRDSIALLLTDLLMPAGLSGQELASRLQQEKPQLKVIFTSGYSDEISGRQLELHIGESFLQKPFVPDQLLHTIRACLDD